MYARQPLVPIRKLQGDGNLTSTEVAVGAKHVRVDLPYVVSRAKKLKTKLDWGRSGGFLRSRPSRLQIAEKTIDYPKFTVGGRHFVDTFLLAQFYDVGMRTLSGFERIDVAQHFGFCDAAEISALTGKALQREYLTKSERFRKRALCAVRETRALADLLSPSYFIQAQIFPYNYQDVIVRGNATRINALFLREYLRQRHSIPEMPMARSFEGGFTAIYFTGVARNVWHCDVASLYPSIMLQFDCFPVTDQLQIFRHLLTDLRSFRLEAKGQMQLASKEGNRGGWHHLHALQNTFKILINSFYGYLGFAQGNFADFEAAATIAQSTPRPLVSALTPSRPGSAPTWCSCCSRWAGPTSGRPGSRPDQQGLLHNPGSGSDFCCCRPGKRTADPECDPSACV